MRKIITICLSLMFVLALFTGCDSDSEVTENNVEISSSEIETTKATTKATTAKKICDHKWIEATCNEPETCQICGKTIGIALSHDWIPATCTSPKTCSRCGETEGSALGHNWEEATYDTPKTCRNCGITEGSPLDASSQYQLTVITSIPAEFSYYNFKNVIQNTVQITDVSYEFEPSSYSNDADLYIYFSGTKIYDVNGSGQTSTSKVSLKLYDSEGYVVDTSTFYSPGLCVGDSFRNEYEKIYNLEPGSYTLELLNTN